MANNLNEPTPPVEIPPDGVKWFRENSIPIAAVMFLVLVVCMAMHSGSINTASKAKDASDIFNNIVQGVAIIIGGGWAIFTFRKGRQFQETLVLNISGKIVSLGKGGKGTGIIVNTRIHNIGHSKVTFLLNASTLEVFEYLTPSITDVFTVPDNSLTRFNPLDKKDLYIEPNEIIFGTKLIAIPNPPDVGFRLDFTVISTTNNYTWRTNCIVEKSPPDDRINASGCL